MGRKVFQDFAHVLCQRFIEVPSNRDLVNLAILGDGCLRLAITDGKASHNGAVVEPFPYSMESLVWLRSRLEELDIPRDDLRAAVLTVDYTSTLRRKPTLGWLCLDLRMTCQGTVSAIDRDYVANLTGEKSWGLATV